MPYVGKSPSAVGVRSRYYFTASGGETSLSGSDNNGKTLVFTDAAYVDVILNGNNLVSGTDYVAVPNTNTISGLAALVANDVVEIISYDVFSVSDTVPASTGGTFSGSLTVSGNIAVTGTVDSRDVAADGTKLDGIEAAADVTDATNVAAAGAAMLTGAAFTGNVDVTGTVTADSLDIQGDGVISGGSRLTISDIADENNDGIRLDDSTTDRFNNLTQDSSGNFKIQHWTGSTWQNNLTVSTAGNVGIGTSSPDLKLHVDGSNGYPAASGSTPVGHIAIRAKNESSSHGAHIGVGDSPPWATWIQAQDINNLATSYPLLLNPNGGNVGIGTSNPPNKFTVSEGTNQHGVEIAPGTTSYIQAYDRATSDYGDLKIDAQTIAFGTDNGSERLRITSSGNVGIGTSSPSYPLHVQGSQLYLTNAGNTELMTTNTNGGVTGGIQALSNQSVRVGSVSNYNCEMVVNNAVKGTWSPTGLDVTGDVSATGYVTGGAGSIVQQQTISTVTYVTVNPINNWTEVHSNFRISITPKFSNSIIVVQYAIPFNPKGAANILFGFKPFRRTNNVNYDFSTTGGALGTRNLLQSAFARSNNGFDINDQNQYTLLGVDAPNTTSTCSYGFYYSSEGSNTTLFCHSDGNNSNWGWTAPVHIIATEIRQ